MDPLFGVEAELRAPAPSALRMRNVNWPKAKARRAGILYLLMGMLGWFSIMYVPSALIVRNDAAATARNIADAELLFRLGILSQIVSQILFLFLALLLYDLFQEVDRKHARLVVTLVAVSVAIEVANCLNLIAPLILWSNADALSAFTKAQLDALGLFFLRLRNSEINVVSTFWGLWLFPLGVLVIRSGWFPKVLGFLLMASCIAYVAGSFTSVMFPTWMHAVTTVTLPVGGIGEFAIILWFVVVGAKVPAIDRRT
jgi:hypothetical protein